MCKNQLFQRKGFNTFLQSVTIYSTFILSELHFSAIKPASSLLRCQFKILVNSMIKVLLSILEPLQMKFTFTQMLCFDFIGAINQLRAPFLTQFLKGTLIQI